MPSTALPPLSWTIQPLIVHPSLADQFHVGSFHAYGEGDEGRYRVEPIAGLNQDELVTLHFAPALPNGESVEAAYGRLAELSDDEKHAVLLASGLASNELGRIATLHLALGVIETWRQYPEAPEGSLAQQLAAGGFVYRYNLDGPPRLRKDEPAEDPGQGTRQYHKDDGEAGFYELTLKDTGVVLRYERHDQEGCHNLLLLWWGGEGGAPDRHWPAGLGEPAQLAVTAALKVARAWDPRRALARP